MCNSPSRVKHLAGKFIQSLLGNGRIDFTVAEMEKLTGYTRSENKAVLALLRKHMLINFTVPSKTAKGKELSPYAPDRWIRELNRRYPSLWTDLRKGYQDPIAILRLGGGGIDLLNSVPDWCIMPTLFPFLLMTSRYGMPFYLAHMDEMMTMASMYIWRCSKGVYRFASEIYDALVRQPLSGNLPQECLYHMPEWAVYIETPWPVI